MSPSVIKTLIQGMVDTYFAMERENWALRKILQKQGLSDAAIQRKVVAYLKNEDYRKAALQRVHELSEEILKRVPALDAEELLAELPIKGEPQ